MKIALAAFLAFSLFPLADPDQQPACREGCEEAYAAERRRVRPRVAGAPGGRVPRGGAGSPPGVHRPLQ